MTEPPPLEPPRTDAQPPQQPPVPPAAPPVQPFGASPGWPGQPAAAAATKPGMPTFVKAFVIFNIVQCGLSLLMLPVMPLLHGITGPDPAYQRLAPYMTATTLWVVAFGLTGNILILRGKPAGLVFAWLNIVGMACGTVTGVLYAMQPGAGGARPGSLEAEMSEAMMLPSVLMGLALTVCYVIAVVKAGKYFAEKKATGTGGMATPKGSP
jgi:hypothetical protein